MKVILCDKCEKILKIGENIIYGFLYSDVILEGLQSPKVQTNMLYGQYFCSIKCIKDRLDESERRETDAVSYV